MDAAMEDLVAEVAAKHGVAIGRDDPILVLHTINDRLLRESAAAQQALLDAYKHELEAQASRWSANVTERADRVLHAALSGCKDMIATQVEEGACATAASVNTAVDAALARVAARLQDARRIATLNVIAACITLAAAGLVVWSSLR